MVVEKLKEREDARDNKRDEEHQLVRWPTAKEVYERLQKIIEANENAPGCGYDEIVMTPKKMDEYLLMLLEPIKL